MSANKHPKQGCPVITHDTRVLSNWEPTRVITEKIALANGFNPSGLNSNEFRAFLQNNANAIRAHEQAHLTKAYACPLPVNKTEIMRPYA
jgi:hypothetical protein